MKNRIYILTLMALTLAVTVGLGFSQSPATTLFLPGDETLGPAAFDQMEPAIGLGNGTSLVVWTDYRTGGDHLLIDESGADIFAARLDASGTLIDTTPILLTMAAGDDTNPKIAWNGENWLVIWLSQTPTQFFWSTEVQAIRVSPSGQVLDPAPITVYKYDSSQDAEAEVASDGTNWVVVMQGPSGNGPGVLAARVAADGTVLDPGGVVLVPGDFSMTFNVDVAFVVDEYLLTYLHQGNVLGLRFDSDLQFIDANPFTIVAPSDGAQHPHVASNGTDFFVVWGEYNNGTQYGQGRGTRINYAGQVLDPGGLVISDLIFGGVDDPRIDWDGTNWVNTYKKLNFGSDPDILLASRITTDGQVLDVGGVNIEPVTTGYAEPDIAQAVGGGTQLVWQDNRAGGANPNDISAFSLSTDLTFTTPWIVSFSAPAQIQPDVATSGSGEMIVFLSTVSGDFRVMAHPVDAEGLPLLSEPLMLDNNPNLTSPAVAWNGSLYFVVWSEVAYPNRNDSVVWGQRINADGTLVDANPVSLMEGFGSDVAAVGDVFLVVTIQQTFNAEAWEPFGIRVEGATGTILDANPIDLGFSFTRNLAVTGLSDRWLVANQRNFSHDDENAEINAIFVEANGSLSAPIGVAGGLNPYLYTPDIANDGTNALIVWANAALPDPNVQGARVLSNGTVESIIPVNTLPEAQDQPAIAWDGTQYVTLYQDLRNITFFLDERSDVFGTLLTASGNVIDPQGFAVYNAIYPEINPAITASNGVSFLTSGLFRAETGYMAYRIGYSLLGDELPTPTPTDTATITPTPSETLTPTPTETASPTPTGSITPSEIPPSPTETPSPTATEPPPSEFQIFIPMSFVP